MYKENKTYERAKKERLILAFLKQGKPVKSGNPFAPTNRRWGINTRTSGLAEAYARAFGYQDFFQVLAEMEAQGKILIDRRTHIAGRMQKKFPSWAIYLPDKVPPGKRALFCRI